MDITISRITLTLAVLLVIISCCYSQVEANPSYIAFPRMGRSKPLNRTRILPIFFPRKRNDADNVFTSSTEDLELQKKLQLPWNFISPRKRGIPRGFIIPRKRATAEDLGYLAFPRMGRSQLKSETSADVSACCGVGVKAEFFIGQDGKEVLRSACAPHLDCCEGLREIFDEKTDGVSFSLCVPETPLTEDSAVRTSEVFNKLKHLLEN